MLFSVFIIVFLAIVGVLFIVSRSNIGAALQLFFLCFGWLFTVVTGCELCRLLLVSDKKRHATLVKSNTRFLRANT